MNKLHLFLLLICSSTLQSSAENNEQNLRRNEQLFYYATQQQDNLEKVLLVNFSLSSDEKFTNLRCKLQDRNKSFVYCMIKARCLKKHQALISRYIRLLCSNYQAFSKIVFKESLICLVKITNTTLLKIIISKGRG